jgi:hypothetical protein
MRRTCVRDLWVCYCYVFVCVFDSFSCGADVKMLVDYY